MRLRLFLRRVLRWLGYDFHSLPNGRLGLRDLHFDLPQLVRLPSPLIIDVGANKGQTIELMKGCFPSGQIVAFEPNPDLHPKLREQYRSKGVTVEGVLLGNSSGTIEFIVLKDNELSSVLEIDRNANNPFCLAPVENVVTVPIITLDSYCAMHGIDRVHILKVDTQGYDLEGKRPVEALLLA